MGRRENLEKEQRKRRQMRRIWNCRDSHLDDCDCRDSSTDSMSNIVVYDFEEQRN